MTQGVTPKLVCSLLLSFRHISSKSRLAIWPKHASCQVGTQGVHLVLDSQ